MSPSARVVSILVASIAASALVACSSDGTTPNCPTEADCLEPAKGGAYYVGDSGTGDEPEPEPEPDAETE